ncbi:GntR family transcriptional regulator [Blastomonas sp. AAP53]|uniref:GntR family transcriptional regulator n=1 Tax=Blastomonas sp. AAP53 TaxID=1248760 RepID=UPI000301C9D8|nr:GntR family transcriptional regulator [Blastomonas sp. AAP53]
MLEKNHAFEKAYAALYHNLRVGSFPPGSRIQAADLVSQLKISATPVREALSRLAGQGLLIDRPAIGYFVPAIDPVDLQHCYSLASMLAQSACRNFDLTWPDKSADREGQALNYKGAGQLLRTIAFLTPNTALQHVASYVDDRLARIVPAEVTLFEQADASQGSLRDWLQAGNRRFCTDNVRRFYARRINSVLEIASAAGRPPQVQNNIF